MHGIRTKHPVFKCEKEISQIEVQPGEVLTVWLGRMTDDGGRSQVELRVEKDGRRFIYLDDERVTIRDFQRWPPDSENDR